MFICKYCGSERINHNSWRNHERCCPLNKDRRYKNGMLGKTGSNQFTLAEQNGLPKPYHPASRGFKGKTHSEKTKKLLSEKTSLNNKGGRCKWFEVDGKKVQGTWERDFAIKLTKMGIKWLKPSTLKHALKYNMDGKDKTYTPDFYLIENDFYVEIKGRWWGNDRRKMDLVIEQNPDIKIKVIEHDEFQRIMGGELVW